MHLALFGPLSFGEKNPQHTFTSEEGGVGVVGR